jgi:hypothetical protein
VQLALEGSLVFQWHRWRLPLSPRQSSGLVGHDNTAGTQTLTDRWRLSPLSRECPRGEGSLFQRARAPARNSPSPQLLPY